MSEPSVGLAIHVGRPQTASGAAWRLPDVAAVHAWLEALAATRPPPVRDDA